MATVVKVDPSSYLGTYPVTNAVVAANGDLGYVTSDAVSLADANTGPAAANGFIYVSGVNPGLTSVTGTGATGPKVSLYSRGVIGGLSSLTVGAKIYLSGTAGGYTATQPSTNADVMQCVGVAISATEVQVDIHGVSQLLKFQTAGNSTVGYVA